MTKLSPLPKNFNLLYRWQSFNFMNGQLYLNATWHECLSHPTKHIRLELSAIKNVLRDLFQMRFCCLVKSRLKWTPNRVEIFLLFRRFISLRLEQSNNEFLISKLQRMQVIISLSWERVEAFTLEDEFFFLILYFGGCNNHAVVFHLFSAVALNFYHKKHVMNIDEARISQVCLLRFCFTAVLWDFLIYLISFFFKHLCGKFSFSHFLADRKIVKTKSCKARADL